MTRLLFCDVGVLFLVPELVIVVLLPELLIFPFFIFFIFFISHPRSLIIFNLLPR